MKRLARAWPARLSLATGIAVALAAGFPRSAGAIDVVPAQSASKLSVDVWINKEEGGVYQPGESMRIFFRSSTDAYVLVYNIDTEGFIHLVYPYGPSDPPRVEAGRTHRIPARHDPYDLVADGPPGMEFVVAVASRLPFQNLPWYLSPASEGAPEPGEGDVPEDDLASGVIVGDPYVGMERINRMILPPRREGDAASNETYFYIGQRVEYPRYVCADCHYSGFGFDPYLGVCSVVSVQVDATWVRYAPVAVGVARPRYYYTVRPTAPTRYRAWKDRWSTLDGTPALRSKFVAERSARTRSVGETRQLRAAGRQEIRDLRRSRPGRLWQGRDEVLKLWEQQRSGEKIERPRVRNAPGPKSSHVERPPTGRGRKSDGEVQQRDDQDKGKERKESTPPKGADREREKPAPPPKGEDREKSTPPPKSGDQDKPSKPPKENGREKSNPPSKSAEKQKPAPPPKGSDRGGYGH